MRCIKYAVSLLGYGGEDAETSTKLLDGSSGFKPAVPLLLLGLEELITEMLPLLRGERAQDPATLESQVGLSGESSGSITVLIKLVAISQQKCLREQQIPVRRGETIMLCI